jgi:hypothetical protein
MPFFAQNIGIAYYPIPKNGGTAIRHLLYELEYGVRCTGEVYISWHFQSVAFNPELMRQTNLTRVVVLRDPIQRFISAYRDKIIAEKVVNARRLVKFGLPPDLPQAPDINFFVDHLLLYRQIDIVKRHTRPQTFYAGYDLSVFDRVFRLESIWEFEEFLSARVGRHVQLEHTRKSPPIVADLSARSLALLQQLYARDFELLNRLPAAAGS